MVVVPALAHHEERDEPVVPGLVARGVVAPAEHVADRVHGKGRVLVGEDPDEPAPDEPGDAALDRAAHRVPDRERDPEAEHDPEDVEAVDGPDQPVLVRSLP